MKALLVSMLRSVLGMILLLAAVTRCGVAADRLAPDTASAYPARDSLQLREDPSADAQKYLETLGWHPAGFDVHCRSVKPSEYDWLVQFPSPRAHGHATLDRVALEWFAARDEQGQLMSAPAVIVVHESGAGMSAGRLFARSLKLYGVHAFLIHLPFYGTRKTPEVRPEDLDPMHLFRQGIGDVRRARDAVAVLPPIAGQPVSLQGTSLGGFVAALTGALDDGFSQVFVMLAGGDLYSMIVAGEQDTAKVRAELAEAGYEGDALRELLWSVEPKRLAHRLNPQRTWLYSAAQDRVVPLANARALATAARLDGAHHQIVPGDHYSAILFFPTILDHMVQEIKRPGR